MSHYKIFPTQLIDFWSLESEFRNQVDFEISCMILASVRPLTLKPWLDYGSPPYLQQFWLHMCMKHTCVT